MPATAAIMVVFEYCKKKFEFDKSKFASNNLKSNIVIYFY